MNTNTPLGDRMKRYEAATQTVLPPRTHTIIRVDGRNFHHYLRNARRPYDEDFITDMDTVAAALCHEIAGTQFAYAQSDEISLCLIDYQNYGTQPWFAGEVQKICSIAAATATAYLMRARGTAQVGTFDARVFTITDPYEVANYFGWRQRDAVRNSITMAAQAKFSHHELHGVNGDQMQEMLFQQHGINWNDYPDPCKRGRLITRDLEERETTWTHKRTGEEHTSTAVRAEWVSGAAPRELVPWVLASLPAMHGSGAGS